MSFSSCYRILWQTEFLKAWELLSYDCVDLSVKQFIDESLPAIVKSWEVSFKQHRLPTLSDDTSAVLR